MIITTVLYAVAILFFSLCLAFLFFLYYGSYSIIHRYVYFFIIGSIAILYLLQVANLLALNTYLVIKLLDMDTFLTAYTNQHLDLVPSLTGQDATLSGTVPALASLPVIIQGGSTDTFIPWHITPSIQRAQFTLQSFFD